MNLNSLFNLRAADLWLISFLALFLFWIEHSPKLGRGFLEAIHRLFGIDARSSSERNLLGDQTVGDPKSSMIRHVFLALAVLAGLISITVAMEG